MTLSVALRNAIADFWSTRFDGDATAGFATLNIYKGVAPADPTTAILAADLLASVTVPGDAFAVAANGTAGKNGVWEDLAIDAGGTASFFRLIKGTHVVQGSVGTTGAEMIVDSVNFVQNGTFTVNTFNLNV